MRSRTTTLILISALVWSGFLLRLYGIARTPYRGDEAFTAQYWAGLPLSESLTRIATIEPHPVLTYAIFRGWGLMVGTAELPLRMLPVLINVLGIPAIYGLSRRLGAQSRTAVLAAFLYAIHPYEIWHSQDARNYAIWAGLSILSLWLGMRAIRGASWRPWIAYGVVSAVTINVFYFEAFVIAAFGLSILLLDGIRMSLRWALAVLPGIATAVATFLLLQAGLVSSGTYLGTSGTLFDPVRFVTWFLPSLVLGETIPSDLGLFAGITTVVAWLLALVLIARRDKRMGTRLAFLSLAPLIILAVVTLGLRVFNARYILPVSALIVIVGASALEPWPGIHRRRYLRSLGWAGILIWTGLSLYSLANYAFDRHYAKSHNWPQITAYLAGLASSDDAVIQLSIDPAFGYYYRGQAAEMALPARPNQPIDDIERVLDQLQHDHRGIWIVGRTFPDWPNAGIVERWLAHNMQPALGGESGGIAYSLFLPWAAQSDIPQNIITVRFADVVALEGTSVILSPDGGRNLTVWLYWRPLQQTSVPLKIFVHLEGPINPATETPLWAQDDQFPQDGRVSTAEWEPDEVLRDIYRLDLTDVPPGAYTLQIGLYDPVTGKRLHTNEDDSATIALVTVNQEGRLDVRPSSSAG